MTTSILIVDDSTVSRSITIRSLPKDWEVEITHASNGRDALIALHDKPHQVILLDLNMPVMDGYEVLKVIHHWKPPRPVIIVLSGDVQPEAQALVKRLGASAFLRKPVHAALLLSALKEVGIL